MPEVVSQEVFRKLVERRRAEKMASRARDEERLRGGEISPEELQRENSPWPEGYFDKAHIENLHDVVGH